MWNNKSKILSFSLLATFIFVFIQCCFSAPVDSPNDTTLYSIFVANMTQNNCTLPSQIPVSFGAKETSLEASLQICNMPDYLKYNKEVKVICSEIFGLLKNISCSPQNALLPSIRIPLSADVCKDFAVYGAALPKGLLKHLSDSFDCKLMCADDIEESCKVLLWSFLVQSQMKESENGETGKTTKTSSVTAAKTTSKLQENPGIEKSTDGKTQDDMETPVNKAVKIPEPDELSHALTSLKAKTVPDNEQELVSVEPDVQEPSANLHGLNSQDQKILTVQDDMTVPDVTEPTLVNNSEIESEKAENELKTYKIKNLIPIQKNLNARTNHEETNVNDNLKNKTPPNPVSIEPTVLNNKVKTEIQTKSPNTLNELDPDISNKAVAEDLREEDAKKQETLKPESTVSDKKIEFKNTVPENDVNSMVPPETEHKSEVSETKVDDSGAVLGEKSPISPSNEATPAADATAAAVSVGMSESISSPTSVATLGITPSLEKMDDEIPLPNDKDSDQYNLDNGDEDLDRDYSNKQEYGDAGMYEPTKNKESIPETPKSVDVPKEPAVSLNDDTKGFNELSSRDSFGRSSEDIQVLAAFPDQEDSHFFFYFLSMVLILMAGYLIFHNKQKIIALIVEGRHERRRRSHGLGYKKLETK